MKLRSLSVFVIALLASGCIWPRWAEVSEPAAAPPDAALEGHLSIAPGDGLMVVYFRGSPLENASQEIESCVEGEIRAGRAIQRIVSFDEFRRYAFPQLEEAAVPRDPTDLGILFEDPNFRKRVASLDIRWIVFVSGISSTNSSDISGGGSGGVVSGASTEKSTSLDAAIVSVDDLSHGLHLAASAAGWQVFAAGAIGGGLGAVPFLIFLPVFTEGPACHALGRRVAERLNSLSSQRGER